jgi:predicted nucleic acid-binding protein
VITIVLDASVAIEVFCSPSPDPELRRRVLTATAAAPEIFDLEACNVLRKMVLRERITAVSASGVLRDIRDAPVIRLADRHLVQRVWDLRDTITAYDASYVALAELLDVPLVTCDARLARASGHGARVDLYPSS